MRDARETFGTAEPRVGHVTDGMQTDGAVLVRSSYSFPFNDQSAAIERAADSGRCRGLEEEFEVVGGCERDAVHRCNVLGSSACQLCLTLNKVCGRA